jgi:NTP pyrophosphatase (non-canonical NTP hydrolase)
LDIFLFLYLLEESSESTKSQKEVEEKMRHILLKAQQQYGFANQVTVVTEELCELASVLAKYPRYPSHEVASFDIRDKVVEEVGDVMICLEHLKLIFNISEPELDRAMEVKIERLERWINSGKGLYQTTVDREVRKIEPEGI